MKILPTLGVLAAAGIALTPFGAQAFDCPNRFAAAQAAIDKVMADMKGMEGEMSKGDMALVHALLTMVRYWLADGGPRPDQEGLSRFPAWAAMLGGILMSVGVDGFLANVEEFQDEVDSESAEWQSFVEAKKTRDGITHPRPVGDVEDQDYDCRAVLNSRKEVVDVVASNIWPKGMSW